MSLESRECGSCARLMKHLSENDPEVVWRAGRNETPSEQQFAI